MDIACVNLILIELTQRVERKKTAHRTHPVPFNSFHLELAVSLVVFSAQISLIVN